ncbi:MAG: hypothetical protein ACR2MN_02325 [Acidimicrobiales bacterium]
MRRAAVAGIMLLPLTLFGCGGDTTSLGPPATSRSSCVTTGAGADVLPDRSCTPGATNPAVTQATIESTICVSGWTARVRPSESVTEVLKATQMAAYGDQGPIGSYEEDHLIPLELGGATADPRNLWPEPGPSPNAKDGVENAAKAAVCSGSISLSAAQAAIAANWVIFGRTLGHRR